MIALAAGELEAAFAPQAGMVCHSLRHRGQELLAQRDGIEGYMRTGRWMGVPLLHPWANRLDEWSYEALGRRVDLGPLAGDVVVRDRKTGLPIHGVLPRAWQVVEQEAARAVAEWTPDEAAFPFPHRVRLEAELFPTVLRISTTLEALEGEVPVVFGFHPWIALPGVPRGEYAVELPAMRRLELDEQHLPTGAAERVDAFSGALPEHELDDGFDEVADGAVFSVTGGGRRVALCHESGFPCAQVFAPPEKDLICFEPMTAPGNALRAGGFAVASPGAPYTAIFSIAVDTL